MTADATGAERQRRWRLRQAGQLEPALRLNCSTCGKVCTGAHGGLCRDCFRRTPEGREWQRLRIAEYRRRRSQPVTDGLQ
jgi:hypothetical protein